MKRSTNNHTTLVLLLLDGTHRTTQWYAGSAPDFNQIKKSMKETVSSLRDGNEVTWAFLACGQQHQQYTGNEVKELTE